MSDRYFNEWLCNEKSKAFKLENHAKIDIGTYMDFSDFLIQVVSELAMDLRIHK